MHDASLAPAGPGALPGRAEHPDAHAIGTPARLARQGNAAALALALQDSRRDTLATFAACEAALPGLVVPQRAELNPPLWELGHIGWFQSWWLGRYPSHAQGVDADPDVSRHAPARTDADRLYNSSHVPHHARWHLPLPHPTATRADVQRQLDETMRLLAQLPPASTDERSLYFFRLVLLHEDMHHEAALYMAQALGIPSDDARWQPAALPTPPPALHLAAGHWRLGSAADAGFAFDNELCAHDVDLPTVALDAQVVRWAEFLPFVEAGGYADEHWWTPAGRVWRVASGAGAPRYLQREGDTWLQNRQGRWQPLRAEEAACHLTQHEALAWCRWAGRRLPTEGEWERAAVTAGPAFRWGDVWEWTASNFAPYPGFRAHPYRDYSAPWFDGRPVLRGASFMTQPRMRHPRYRNYFPPARNDVPAGFRSCSV